TFNAKSLLGGALLGQKKYADAERLLLAGYEQMKQREDKIPAQARFYLTQALARLVQLYAAMDKKDQANAWWTKWAETTAQMTRAGNGPANDVYNVGCMFAECVPLAERNKERAQNYADHAIAMLRQAVENGFRNTAHMKKDKDLDPLRSHPEFLKLLKELEEK